MRITDSTPKARTALHMPSELLSIAVLIFCAHWRQRRKLWKRSAVFKKVIQTIAKYEPVVGRQPWSISVLEMNTPNVRCRISNNDFEFATIERIRR